MRRFFAACYPYAPYLFPLAGAILALIHTYILIGPGLNQSGDNEYHILNEFAILRGILGGDNPLGPVGMEFGQPVLRFYQALFYLCNVAETLVTGIDLKTTHNVTIVVCFAASPFSFMYFLKKVGLRPFAAGLGSLASMISIAAFGNSFEAYHQAGIVTQSMGGFFFPWFMGSFVGMLRGENRASSAAMLFALAFISHAAMSVFAVFSGVLYFLVASSRITKEGIKRIFAFGALGICLVAFWVLPFIEHTQKMRPIPDSIVRGAGVHWFTSVSKDELMMVLLSGRLLDDPPRKGDNKDDGDKLMDNISIIHTLSTRPPAVTILTGLGCLVALIGFRRAPQRFLLSGFLFSLMLFAGPDDFRWLWRLPFMSNFQTFRTTYLVEFFAFGLVGLGVEAVLRRSFIFARRRQWKPVRWGFTAIWALVALGTVGLCGAEEVNLGNTHVRIRDAAYMDSMVDACGTLADRGRPFRIMPKYEGRYKLRQSWFAVHGFIPYCTHWKGTGPTAAMQFCDQLGMPSQFSDLNALAGARYYSGTEDKVKAYIDAKDSEGFPLFQRLPSGKDRKGKPTGWHYLIDTGRESFLRPLVGEPLPVVCSYSQWVWLAKSWTTRYRSRLWEEETPITMHVAPGTLNESGLLSKARSILYLDHAKLEEDRQALQSFVKRGGIIISPEKLEGIATVTPETIPTKKVWDTLPNNKKRASKLPDKDHREELDPGFDIADITVLPHNWRSEQNFAYDIDALRQVVAILPMQAVPGWTATVDGKAWPTFSTGPDMVGLMVPKGAHRLIFQWKMPTLGWVSLIMTFSALLLVLFLWGRSAWLWYRRRATAL